MKIKLFQLAMTFVAVVALASAGITEIQYFEDFESYDVGYDIYENPDGFSNLEAWGDRYGQSTPQVVDTDPMVLGNKSVVTTPLGEDVDHGIILRHLQLPLESPIIDTSVIGLWVMRGPRTETFQLRFQGGGWEYGLMLTDNHNFFQYKCDGCGTPSGWTPTDIPCEPDTWYRVMWAGTGSSVDLYVEEELLYSSAGRNNIGPDFDLFLVRHDSRIDNVFIATDLDNVPSGPGITAVDSAGKLTTTWGGIKAE